MAESSAGRVYHRILGRVLILVVVVIVYVSLYPWHFAPVHLTVSPLWILVHSWHPPPFRYYVRDFINNIVLYAPLGFAAHFVFRKSGLPGFGLYGPVLLGLLLSTAMELTQLLEPVRETSIVDVIMNVAGSACGVMIALLFESISSRRTLPAYRLQIADRGALLLTLCWFGWLFFPFFPVISLYYPYDKVAVFTQSRLIEMVPLVSTAAAWFAAELLIPAIGIRMPRRWFALSLLAVPAQFLILGRQPVPSFLLGAVAGVLIFAIFDRFSASWKPQAWFFAGMLVLRGLASFHSDTRAAASADWQAPATALLEKGFFYGTAIWLMRKTGMTLVRSVALIAAVLAAIEIMQVLLPGRTPEIIDPMLAILMGVVLAAVSRPTLILSPEREKQFRSAG